MISGWQALSCHQLSLAFRAYTGNTRFHYQVLVWSPRLTVTQRSTGCGNVCISILDGAFNQQGAADWAEQLQRTWMQQGQPTHWAHVVDMEGWLGRTPESTELIREGIAWAQSHGLRCTVLVMAQGARNIFLKINQATHPVIPQDADVTICENHKQAIELLQQRGFIVSLLQLSSRKRIRHTSSKPHHS